MKRLGILRGVSHAGYLIVAAAFGVGGVAAPAQAATETASFVPGSELGAGCGFVSDPLRAVMTQAPALTKSAALLGGGVSALEAIRLQQAAVIPSVGVAISYLADASALPKLTPGIGPSVATTSDCGQLVAPRIVGDVGITSPVIAPPLDSENYLASKRIRIGHTSFDSDWKRVQRDGISRGTAKRYLGALSGDREETLAKVNGWVNRQITYTEDRDLFGKADYWAGARRTLKLHKGDCEDIALLKMQMLAAAGIPREDMILTIARDLVRQADHAVLIVRSGAGYRLLDNATDTVADAAPRSDYRAILSFGAKDTWLHGA